MGCRASESLVTAAIVCPEGNHAMPSILNGIALSLLLMRMAGKRCCHLTRCPDTTSCSMSRLSCPTLSCAISATSDPWGEIERACEETVKPLAAGPRVLAMLAGANRWPGCLQSESSRPMVALGKACVVTVTIYVASSQLHASTMSGKRIEGVSYPSAGPLRLPYTRAEHRGH